MEDSPAPSPAPSTNPSAAPAAYAYTPVATGAGATAVAAAAAATTPAVLVGGYAVDVNLLLQRAKDFKQQGLLELNNILHSAVAQVKGSMHPDRRKLLEYATF